VVLFPSDEVLMHCANHSVTVEELEAEDEDGGEHDTPAQPRSQLVPLTSPLYLVSLSKNGRR
jgi:hypothetical protein